MSSPRRIPELDGLRGIAIFLVILWHYPWVVTEQAAAASPWFFAVRQLLAFSWSGVDLFFVLSGFLIGGILLDNRSASNYFSVFYLRRACRIFPIYYVLLFVILGVQAGSLPASLEWATPIVSPPLPMWSYFSYTQNIVQSFERFSPHWIGVTWSLSVEEQFYLLLPLVIRLVPLSRLPLVLGTGILAATGVRLAVMATMTYWNAATYVLFPCRMDALLLGVLAAMHVRGLLPWTVGPTAIRRAVWVFGGALAALLAFMNVTGWGLGIDGGIGSIPMAAGGYTLLALFYSCVLLITLDAGGTWGRIVRWRPLCYLGTISYGVYLLHTLSRDVLLSVVRGGSGPSLLGDALGITIAFVLCVAVASFSWTFFEKTLVNLGKRRDYKFPDLRRWN